MKGDVAERVIADASSPKGTVILGLGNILQQDDGVGVHALRWLKQHAQLYDDADFVDGGTISFLLLETIETTRSLIVLDAIVLDSVPGTVHIFEGPDMDRLLSRSLAGSVHEVSLSELMDMARLRDVVPPRRALVGVEPEVVAWGDGLTPSVEAALPRMADAVDRVLTGWRHGLA